MANTSETYNFIKQDQDTRLFSRDAQEVMAESVQMAFHHLVGCLQYDLQQTMPAFIDPDDSVDDDDFGVAGKSATLPPQKKWRVIILSVLKLASFFIFNHI